MKKTPMGLFFVQWSPKPEKRINLYKLDGHSNTLASMNETKFAQLSFLYERVGKELKYNP